MVPKSQNKLIFSDLTPSIGGKDLSELLKLWKDIAKSEIRLKLMVELRKKELGFNEIENFRLGLKYSLKSEKLRGENSKPIQRVIKSAMNLKMRDEIHHLNELKRKRNRRNKKEKQGNAFFSLNAAVVKDKAPAPPQTYYFH